MGEVFQISQARDLDVLAENSTENASNSETNLDNMVPFDHIAVTVVASILIFLLCFGFFANLITIIVIASSSRLKSIFFHFILSLCVSDLISAAISWINLYRRTWGFNDFSLPEFFCWFYWGTDVWTSYVTSLHILSFAIIRLLSVWKPIFFSRIEAMHAKVWIAIIWIIAFFTGFVPMAIFSGVEAKQRGDLSNPIERWPTCTQKNESLSQYTVYIKYAYPIFFYMPLVAIAVVSVLIGVVICSRKFRSNRSGENNNDKEKQAILQLALIVGSFMLGYLPFTVFEFWAVDNNDVSYEGWRKEWLFGTIQYICLRFSECLNPVFYNLASTKMRKETLDFFRRCRINTSRERGTASSPSNVIT